MQGAGGSLSIVVTSLQDRAASLGATVGAPGHRLSPLRRVLRQPAQAQREIDSE
jgi:hypothetical protein